MAKVAPGRTLRQMKSTFKKEVLSGEALKQEQAAEKAILTRTKGKKTKLKVRRLRAMTSTQMKSMKVMKTNENWPGAPISRPSVSLSIAFNAFKAAGYPYKSDQRGRRPDC